MSETPSRSECRDVLLLLSGGVDSSTCAAFLCENGKNVRALFVDYGQPACEAERASTRLISARFKIPLTEVRVDGLVVAPSGYIGARNVALFALALNQVMRTPMLIAIGLHDGVPYPDCGARFLSICQAVADLYHDGAVTVIAPLIAMRKEEVIRLAKHLKVPLEYTYSCEAGSGTPCGSCLSCRDRMRFVS